MDSDDNKVINTLLLIVGVSVLAMFPLGLIAILVTDKWSVATASDISFFILYTGAVGLATILCIFTAVSIIVGIGYIIYHTWHCLRIV